MGVGIILNMKLFISDIRFIARRPLLLTALLSPVIFTLFLFYLVPFISGLNRHEDALSYGRYYSLAAITLISAIPFIYGLLFSFVHMNEFHIGSIEGTEFLVTEAKSILISRLVISAVLSFIMVLPAIYITGAVSTEGWLRSIYAAFLLAITTPFIFIFSAGFSGNRTKRKFPALISILFLITVPAGLVLHHPWSYFAFFSPFYWLSWAWVIPSPGDSLIYGIISLVLTSAGILIFYRYFLRNSGIV
jgi:hypothetical protein